VAVHLSALMCAEHRGRVLAEIRMRKADGEPVLLVATQLVEAGVDLDFSIVYRALGGLDAMAQAAGRCNREGRLDGLGELRVFHAPTRPPLGVPQTAHGIAQGMLAAAPDLDLFSPSTFVRYFERLYGHVPRDRHGIREARRRLHYREVAAAYRLIEDDWSAPLVVPYGNEAHIRRIEREGPSRQTLRAIQRYIVNLPRRLLDSWRAAGVVRDVADTVAVLDGPFGVAYDNRFGLMPDRVGVAARAALVVEG
jgi:CRISPR-associated endonuclease/helicase Cas3